MFSHDDSRFSACAQRLLECVQPPSYPFGVCSSLLPWIHRALPTSIRLSQQPPFTSCVVHSKYNLVTNNFTLIRLEIALCLFRAPIRHPLVNWPALVFVATPKLVPFKHNVFMFLTALAKFVDTRARIHESVITRLWPVLTSMIKNTAITSYSWARKLCPLSLGPSKLYDQTHPGITRVLAVSSGIKFTLNMADPMFMRMRRRMNMRGERVFRDQANPIDIYDDVELYDRFRFRRNDIMGIVDEIRDDIEYPATRQGSLPAVIQLLIALRFYATGCFQKMVGEMIGSASPLHPELSTESPMQSDNTWTVGYTCQPNTKPTNKRSSFYAWPAFRICGVVLTVLASEFKRPPWTNTSMSTATVTTVYR